MTLFFAKTPALGLKRAAVMGGILLFSAEVRAEPGSEGPFVGLSGRGNDPASRIRRSEDRAYAIFTPKAG